MRHIPTPPASKVHSEASAKAKSLTQQKGDFTAEGSPPPLPGAKPASRPQATNSHGKGPAQKGGRT